MKICSVSDCGGKHIAHGFCRKHYERSMRHGDPSNARINTKGYPLIDRLMTFVEYDAGCLLWLGGKRGKGYGVFRKDGKSVAAHRVAYELFKGPIPEGIHVCHTCDTPACINPNHLFIGTRSDNMKDMVSKGRHWKHNIATGGTNAV